MEGENYNIMLHGSSLRLGGAEKVLANLARALARQGNRVTVVLRDGNTFYPLPTNVALRTVDELDRRAQETALRDLIQSESIDYVLTFCEQIDAIRAVKKRPGTAAKVICVENSTPSALNEHRHPSANPDFLRRVTQKYYSLADHVICGCKAIKQDLVQYASIDPDHMSVIYNPVLDDHERRNRSIDQPMHMWMSDESVDIVLGLGRLVRMKRFPDLVSAFRIVADRRPNARLIVAGDGHARDELERTIDQMDLHRHVWLPGAVRQVDPFLARANVLTLASRTEGLPNVLVEALNAMTPVVATDSPGGNREIVSDRSFGLLVPIGDVHAMADAICAVLDSPVDTTSFARQVEPFYADYSAARYLCLLRRLESTEGVGA